MEEHIRWEIEQVKSAIEYYRDAMYFNPYRRFAFETKIISLLRRITDLQSEIDNSWGRHYISYD